MGAWARTRHTRFHFTGRRELRASERLSVVFTTYGRTGTGTRMVDQGTMSWLISPRPKSYMERDLEIYIMYEDSNAVSS